MLIPQQATAPSSSMAQVWPNPLDIFNGPRFIEVDARGVPTIGVIVIDVHKCRLTVPVVPPARNGTVVQYRAGVGVGARDPTALLPIPKGTGRDSSGERMSGSGEE